LLGYVKDNDVKAAAVLPAENGEEEELAEDWDYRHTVLVRYLEYEPVHGFSYP
jgi:hypothetical protein